MKRPRAKRLQKVTMALASLSHLCCPGSDGDRNNLHWRQKIKLPVKASLSCQCDYIWNQPKLKQLDIPVRGFSGLDHLRQEDTP